jgi:hypothetical protein
VWEAGCNGDEGDECGGEMLDGALVSEGVALGFGGGGLDDWGGRAGSRGASAL